MSVIKLLGVLRFRSLFFLVLIVFPVMFAGCDFSLKDTKGIEPEAMLPTDSMMVMVVDASNEAQTAKLSDLMDKFPEKEKFFEFLKKTYDEGAGKRYKYDKMIEPIFDGDWKVLMGMSGDFTAEDFDVYLVGKFEEAGDMEDLIDEYFDDKDGKYEYKKEDGIKYWLYDASEMYVMRYGDIFVMTNIEENLEKSVLAVEGGDNFMANEEFQKGMTELASENLGYVYMDMAEFDWNALFELQEASMASIASEASTPAVVNTGVLTDLYSNFGKVYSVFGSDEGGISSSSVTYLSEEGMNIFGKDYNVKLVDKVPGDGLFVYTEMPTLNYLVSMLSMYGIDKADKYEGLLDQPVAFSMNDVGEFYPAIGLYVQTDEDSAGSAKNLILDLEAYFDELIIELDVQMLDSGQRAGLLRKELDIISGGAFHKLIFDFSLLSEDILAQAKMFGFDLSEKRMELYYGITGDGVLVLSFYPGFGDFYGESVVSDNENYKVAMEKWKNVKSSQVSYFDIVPFFDIADRYVTILKGMGFMSQESMDVYKNVKANFSVINYLSGVAFFEDGKMLSESYVSIGGGEEK